MTTEARETAAHRQRQMEGTTVYDAKGEKMGSITRIMIEKRSGQVAYAVRRLAAFWASATTTIRSPGPPSAMTPAWVGTAMPTSPSSSSTGSPKYQGNSWDWEDYEASPSNLRLLQHTVDRTLIARGRAGCQQGTGPTYPMKGFFRSLRTLRPWLHRFMTHCRCKSDEYQRF